MSAIFSGAHSVIFGCPFKNRTGTFGHSWALERALERVPVGRRVAPERQNECPKVPESARLQLLWAPENTSGDLAFSWSSARKCPFFLKVTPDARVYARTHTHAHMRARKSFEKNGHFRALVDTRRIFGGGLDG